MNRRVVSISLLDLAADASGDADAFADALSLLLAINRRTVDLVGVRSDTDKCPPTPMGRALARQWNADCLRREQEIAALKRHLDRLRRDAPGVVAHAESWVAEQGPIWVVVPGGRELDG